MNVRQGKDSHNLSINSLAPIHLSGNPPRSLCFKLPVPYQVIVADKDPWTLLHPYRFSMMASPLGTRLSKTGANMLHCHYLSARTLNACKERKNGVADSRIAQQPFLAVPSASAERAQIHEDMNSLFSLPTPETLAALLKHRARPSLTRLKTWQRRAGLFASVWSNGSIAQRARRAWKD